MMVSKWRLNGFFELSAKALEAFLHTTAHSLPTSVSLVSRFFGLCSYFAMKAPAMLRSTATSFGLIASQSPRCSVASSSRYRQLPTTSERLVRPYATASWPLQAEVKGSPPISQTNSTYSGSE